MYNENLRPRSLDRQRRAYLYLRRTHSHRRTFGPHPHTAHHTCKTSYKLGLRRTRTEMPAGKKRREDEGAEK